MALGRDCLDIRVLKELFHIKLSEKAVADISIITLVFTVCFLPKAQRSANFHPELDSVW